MINKYTCKIKELQKLKSDIPINLVLSGGAERGVAHIALLEKLEEMNIKINAISGASAGSLVGVMYASGKTPKEILNFFQSHELFQFSWISLAKRGVFNAEKYASLLEPHIKSRFEDLEIPLTVCATNLNEGVTEYFNKGHILKPILASCAVPGLFNPIEINNKLYSDGGVLDNFPVTPFKDSLHPVVGSSVFATSKKKNKELNTAFKIISHTFKLSSEASEEHKLNQTFATVCFPLDEFSGFDAKEVDAIYTKAKQYIEKNI
ncbi:MAG: hypothetical protein CSA38_04240 [Flavobacteriales bacterium]|nr:MAG: hypothetical protein CSA38_04240 [Flavobacteriales bacterium]